MQVAKCVFSQLEYRAAAPTMSNGVSRRVIVVEEETYWEIGFAEKCGRRQAQRC